MPSKTLVQALEGARFPCDRAQLLDYARRHHVPDDTLEVLAAIPERRYRDLGEVFVVLPPRAEQAAGQHGGEEEEGEGTPLPWSVDLWLQGWQQSLLPLEVTSHCLRHSAEVWPQWMRLAQRLWFPWAK
jgi:hypothetical protein